MPNNPAAENVLGIIGTLCWTVQLIPQIIKSYRTKSVEGLSSILVLGWGLAGVPLGIYNITQNLNLPLIVQPQLFMALCLVSWAQCQYYGRHRSKKTCILLWCALYGLGGAVEAAVIYGIRPVYKNGHGNHAPVDAIGIISAVVISSALLPQYYEIYKHGQVIGISIPFMTVDMLGGVFNFLSLVFKPKLDIFATITYTSVAVLDAVVIMCYFTLNPLKRRRQRLTAARAADVIEEAEASAPAPVLPMSSLAEPQNSAHVEGLDVKEE